MRRRDESREANWTASSTSFRPMPMCCLQGGQGRIIGRISSERVSQNSSSTLGLRHRKFPRTVEDFRSRAEQAHGVVPSLRDWQAIGYLAVAPSELNVDRTIRAFLRREAVQRIGIVGVRMEVPFSVVDRD